MDGERADMVFTDPPYGENYDYRGNDYYEDSPDGYWEWMSITFDILDNILSDGASLYVKHSSRKIMNTAYFLDKRYEIRNLIIWISNSQAHPDNNYDSYYEPIFYCSVGNPKTFNKRAELREKPKDYWSGEGKEFVGLLTNCWYDIPKQQAGLLNPEGGKDGNVKIHSCSMPEKLATRGINVSSNENDIIYDPFLGSGTTLIACERLNRKCRAIEISPAYVAVAIQRWVDVTGGTPVLVE
jgi:site-specific DNA-methyltransferase (adenine-specific)